MAISVTTRSGKGAELTRTELDNNFTNLARSATESAEGNIEIATQAEVTALSDTSKAIVPGYLTEAVEAIISSSSSSLIPFAACSFNSSGTILQSSGITSVSKGGTGTYTVTFDTIRSSANYIISFGAGLPTSDTALSVRWDNKTTTGFTIYTRSCTGGSSRELKDTPVDFSVIDLG